jgi:hypothetical protein
MHAHEVLDLYEQSERRANARYEAEMREQRERSRLR